MSGQPDIADILFDRRMDPPDSYYEGWDFSPGRETLLDWHAGEEGHPCPVCQAPKPQHKRGCHEAGDFGPSHRLTPASFDDTPEWNGY